MKPMWLLAGLTLAAGDAAAVRTVELVEGAYELVLSDAVLPSSIAGSLLLKPCPDCDTVTLRVDGETTYHVGASRVALPDLHAVAGRLRAAGADKTTPLGVFYDRETRRVTRVRLLPAN
jgi:hypothetical protein